MVTIEDIESFRLFAVDQINAGSELTFDELVMLWEASKINDAEIAESVKDLEASYMDWKSGKKMLTAEEFKKDFRSRHGIK